MTEHEHDTPETQVEHFRTHLRDDHGDPEEYKGVTAKGLIWAHVQKHPGYVVVEYYKGTIQRSE